MQHHYALNLSWLDGKATCASQNALCAFPLSRGEMVEEFIVWCYKVFLIIESSKGFSNIQCVPASSVLQTILCVWHFLVCREPEVKCLMLFLREMAFK